MQRLSDEIDFVNNDVTENKSTITAVPWETVSRQREARATALVKEVPAE